jgi:hypothetical protein
LKSGDLKTVAKYRCEFCQNQYGLCGRRRYHGRRCLNARGCRSGNGRQSQRGN